MTLAFANLRRPATLCWVTLLGMGALVHAVPAQQQRSGKIVGSRLVTPQQFNYVRIPPAQKQAVTSRMQALYDIVRRDTMFYEPVTFDVQPSPRIDMPPRRGYTPAEYDLPEFMYAYGSDVPVTAQGKRTTSTHAFWVYGNGLDHFFRVADKWQQDEQGEMYFEPLRLADVKGFPTYGNGLVVITRSARPIYLPVPVERAMRFVIAQTTQGLELMKAPQQQPLVARTRACLATLEKQLAAMSPTERAAPAYIAMGRAPGHDPVCDPFASANDRNARRLIMENPDFYDVKRPPSDIQVVFVNLGSFSPRDPAQQAQVDRITDRLDWPALAAITAGS